MVRGKRPVIRHSIPCQWIGEDGVLCPDEGSDVIWGDSDSEGAACTKHATPMIQMLMRSFEQYEADMGRATIVPKWMVSHGL